MVVEINLLPSKVQKKSPLLLLTILLLLVVFASVATFLYLGNHYDNKIAKVNSDILSTQELAATKQQALVEFETANSSQELKTTVEWAEKYPIKLVPIIKYLTSQLPERGFIQKLTYDESGEIIVTAQFDQTREAAYYQHYLSESEWFTEVFLESVTTGEFYLIEEGYDENKIGNETYIPRYIAEYKLIIDSEVLNKTQHATSDADSDSSSQSEGGGGS